MTSVTTFYVLSREAQSLESERVYENFLGVYSDPLLASYRQKFFQAFENEWHHKHPGYGPFVYTIDGFEENGEEWTDGFFTF